MSPHQRAMLVCQQQPALVAYQNDIQRLEGEVRQAQRALEKGHRKEKRCVRYPAAAETKTTCKTIEDEDGERTECREKTKYTNRRSCEDIFLPINPAQEKQNIQAWQSQIKQMQQARNQGFKACYQRTVQLSPEEAYLRYR